MYGLVTRAAALAATAVLLAGCATVVAGTTQEINITTDPEGATCTLTRVADGSLGSVTPTPGKMTVSRRKDPISVNCTRDGYEPVTEVMESSFSGATIGNILLGGIIGLAIDAASGANNYYPDRVIVIMTPTSFPTAQARDEHFAKVSERQKEAAKKQADTVASQCGGVASELCRIEIRKVEAARDKALETIEAKRLAAKVG
jgi:hypothetical protein